MTIQSILLLYFLTNCFVLVYGQDIQSNIPDSWKKIVVEKLEMRNAPVGDVLRLIASQHGINIFVDPEVDQNVSIYLQNASLSDIMDYLEKEYNFTYEMSGDILEVKPPPEQHPEFHVSYSPVDSSIDIRVASAPFREILDSVSVTTRHNFVYNGKMANTPVRMQLIRASFPDDFLSYLETYSLGYEKRGNLTVISDLSESAKVEGRQKIHRQVSISPEGFITLKVRNEPIAPLIDEISARLDKDIVIYSAPKGNLSINITEVEYGRFLSLVLNGTGFTFRMRGNVYIIGDQKIRGIRSTRVLKLQHMKVEGISKMIPLYLSSNAEIAEIKELNSISVVAFPEVLADIEDFLQKIDKEIPMVLIETVVVDFDITNRFELGLEAGVSDRPIQDSGGIYQFVPGIDATFKGKLSQDFLDNIMGMFGGAIQISKLPDNFFIHLNALEQIGKANVKSKPHIATLNGHEAEIKIGVTQYYLLTTNNYYGGYYNNPSGGNTQNSSLYPTETQRFEKIEATVSLKLTPWITGDNEITVEIHPDFQTPVSQLDPNIPPTIQSRTLNSTVRLKDGETIILGGLIQEIDNETTSQVPILGDIPLLGALFRSTSKTKQKREMIIYITPHLHKDKRSGIDAYTDIRFAD